MPPKKRNWGDIPNINHVKEKDEDGKWIECCLCNIRIRVRSQFCLTEWSMHCSGIKHCNLANDKDLKNMPKMTSFFRKNTIAILFQTILFVTQVIQYQKNAKLQHVLASILGKTRT